MSLNIHTFALGPLENNTYLLSDAQTRQAVLIDPSFGIQTVLRYASEQALDIRQIWLTHAHFDHISGVAEAVSALSPAVTVGLHPTDLPLWNMKGGAAAFGFSMELDVQPNLFFTHGQLLDLGAARVQVRHAPGHTPGHVVFYEPGSGVVFCGDVIFQGSIGRTDLPGGSLPTLLDSIQQQILTLPDETRLLSGHGDETTVGEERRNNPFL
jgi:glyoxylase-like metal-dependent hydrolase (beta-lactamase superfamily II)